MEIGKLDVSKASQMLDKPTRLTKRNCGIFSDFLCANIHAVFEESSFPQQLKYGDIKPVFKKNPRSVQENYRPISILSNISKIQERCKYNQL